MSYTAVSSIILALQQEIDWLDELITLLTDEKAHLVARSFDVLEPMAETKQNLSEKLANSTDARLKMMNISSLAEAKPALEALIAECNPAEAKQLSILNEVLAERLLLCRDLNTVNGQVIASNLHVRQDILNALSGKNTSEALNLYTANGEMSNTARSNSHQEA